MTLFCPKPVDKLSQRTQWCVGTNGVSLRAARRAVKHTDVAKWPFSSSGERKGWFADFSTEGRNPEDKHFWWTQAMNHMQGSSVSYFQKWKCELKSQRTSLRSAVQTRTRVHRAPGVHLPTTRLMLGAARCDLKIMALEKGEATGHPLGAGEMSEQLFTQDKALKRAVQTLPCTSGTLLPEGFHWRPSETGNRHRGRFFPWHHFRFYWQNRLCNRGSPVTHFSLKVPYVYLPILSHVYLKCSFSLTGHLCSPHLLIRSTNVSWACTVCQALS